MCQPWLDQSQLRMVGRYFLHQQQHGTHPNICIKLAQTNKFTNATLVSQADHSKWLSERSLSLRLIFCGPIDELNMVGQSHHFIAKDLICFADMSNVLNPLKLIVHNGNTVGLHNLISQDLGHRLHRHATLIAKRRWHKGFQPPKLWHNFSRELWASFVPQGNEHYH